MARKTITRAPRGRPRLKAARASSVRSPPRSRPPRQGAPKRAGRRRHRPRRTKRPPSRPWTNAEVEEAFRRSLPRSGAARRARAHQPLHAAGGGRALGAGDRRGRQQGDAGRCSRSSTRRRRWSRSAKRGCASIIKTIGLYNTKAKNVIALSQTAHRRARRRGAAARDALETLPGVGRKTANVVLNVAFGEQTIAVDTHVFRVGNRTGMAPGKTPLEVEPRLEKIVPPPYRVHAHHWLILHGRYVCKAQRPLCETCVINDLCRWPQKTTFMAAARRDRLKLNRSRSSRF